MNCEVCSEKMIKWNVILVHRNVTIEDERQGSFSDCEKEIRVCDACKKYIINRCNL